MLLDMDCMIDVLKKSDSVILPYESCITRRFFINQNSGKVNSEAKIGYLVEFRVVSES